MCQVFCYVVTISVNHYNYAEVTSTQNLSDDPMLSFLLNSSLLSSTFKCVCTRTCVCIFVCVSKQFCPDNNIRGTMLLMC